jgi:hypothetical protein
MGMQKSGKMQFVWGHGVFGCGLSTGVLLAVVMAMVRSAECRRELGVLLMVSVPVFLIGGYFWGRAMWWWLTTRQAREGEQKGGT